MKKIALFLAATIIFPGCARHTADIGYVVGKFNEHVADIKAVEYRVQRIDTFPGSGAVWNNTGVALLEKDENDRTFGFAFYGKRDDVSAEFLYHNEIGFRILRPSKEYEIREGTYAFLGSPGGQMISPGIFKLDSVYKSRSLLEGQDSFILRYEFEDDTVRNITDIIKLVELRKDDFFPVKFTRTSKVMGHRNFSQTILSNVRLNGDVGNSIAGYMNEIREYGIIQSAERRPNRLLGHEIPAVSLPELYDRRKITSLPRGRVTLIDFWEPWCGPCVGSLPEIERLKNSYSSQLDIVGIVCDDRETAIRLLDRKGITFLNLVGDKMVRKEFDVSSWPKFFLIDKEGTMQKAYFAFSEEIEKDIIGLLE